MFSVTNNALKRRFSVRGLIAPTVAAIGIGMIGTISASRAFAQDEAIRVVVDGSRVHFDEVRPEQVNGRVMVPLRGVLEKVGAYVDWDADNQRVECNKGDLRIVMHIGERTARVNGRTVYMDVPAETIAGHTMVPLRFLSESLGANVRWDNDGNTVFINTGGVIRRAGDRMRTYNGDRDFDRP